MEMGEQRVRLAEVCSQIPAMMNDIYKHTARTFDYDANLYRSLKPILELVKGSSCAFINCDKQIAIAVAGVISWEDRKATVNVNDSRCHIKERAIAEGTIRLLSDIQQRERQIKTLFGRPVVVKGDGELCDLMIVLSVGPRLDCSQADHCGEKRLEEHAFSSLGRGLCACLMFHWNGLSRLLRTDVERLKAAGSFLEFELKRSIGWRILPFMAEAFSAYERRFSAFPARIREFYWQSIGRREYSSGPTLNSKSGSMPPWDICYQTKETVQTVTLSLDLRKSTYCMEYAASAPRFGRWLEMFTEKMRSVAHQHGGIYDKFTGDGSLVHFLQPECLAIYCRSAIDSAVHCASDMQLVVEHHMQELRQFLQHDSPVFGAGIAIDVGEAHWACDDRDNPVVVGRGVVGACRAGDKALRYMIRLTNVAYRQLSQQVREKLREVTQVDLETKESTFPLKCWQFDSRVGDGLGYGEEEMKKLCREVYERFSRDQVLVGQAPACIP